MIDKSVYTWLVSKIILEFVLLAFQIRQVREVHTLQQIQHNLSTEGRKQNSPNGTAIIRSFIIGTTQSTKGHFHSCTLFTLRGNLHLLPTTKHGSYFWSGNIRTHLTASNRYEYQEYLLGRGERGQCTGLTTLPLCANCLEILGASPSGALRACPGL